MSRTPTAGTAVVFGAGNVGRGLLGQVFCQAGLRVVFADVDADLVAALAAAGCYLHITVDNDSRREQPIGPVDAIRADDPTAVATALATARVAAISVGVRAAPAACAAIAPALLGRIEAGAAPLNLLIAENLHDGPARVRRWLVDAEPALGDLLDRGEAGLIATSIGRMIPAPRPEVRALGQAAIEVEPYCRLPIDARALRGDLPPIPAVLADPSVPFGYYADRKLFVHNMGHAMCAYLGRLCGDREIWQAIGRADLRALVRAAMVESAAAIAACYGRPIGPLLDHVDDLLYRFGNRALGDTIARVGADPGRKLAAGDRLIGAYQLCLAQNIDPRHVRLGLAAGLCQLADEGALTPADQDAFLLAQGLTDPAERTVLAEYGAVLRGGFDATALNRLLDRRFRGAWIP